MGESTFIIDMSEKFREHYPEKDGWEIVQLTDYLSSFRVALLPAVITADRNCQRLDSKTRGEFSWNTGENSTCRRFDVKPFVRVGEGLSDSDWFGELNVLYRGEEIHFVRVQWVVGHYPREVTLVAFKKRDTFELLFHALEKMRKRIYRGPERMHIIGRGIVARPTVGWDDLILPDVMKNDLRSSVETFLAGKKRYKELGIPYRRGFLFTGPPGCGKTMTIRAIAANAKAGVLVLPFEAGTEDSDVNRAFRMAGDDAPSVLILEDLDRVCGGQKISIANLLNLLDGLETREGVLVIATTNSPEKLDPALLQRPSRFDRVWNFDLPDEGLRARFIEHAANGHFSAECMSSAVEMSKGFTLAYLSESVTGAMLKALAEDRDPEDRDLDSSVERLKKEYGTTKKISGNAYSAKSTGFKMPGVLEGIG